MKTYTARLIGISPLGFSAPIRTEKEPNETHDQYDRRCARERIRTDADGQAIIPPNAVHLMLIDAARYLCRSVPGKKGATYKRYFEAAIIIADPIELGVRADDIPLMPLYVPADGKPGGNKRVWRNFPYLERWKGTALINVIDDTITGEVLREHLEQAGQIVGLGFYRPARRGHWGRFRVEAFKEL